MQPSSSALALAILIALPGLAAAGSPAAPMAGPGPFAQGAPVAHPVAPSARHGRPALAGPRQRGLERHGMEQPGLGRPSYGRAAAPAPSRLGPPQAVVRPGARVMARGAGWNDLGGRPSGHVARSGAVVRDVAPPASAYAWDAQPRSSLQRGYGRSARRWSAAAIIVGAGAEAGRPAPAYEAPQHFQEVDLPSTRVVSDEIEATPAPRLRRAPARYVASYGYRRRVSAPQYGYAGMDAYPPAYAPVASSTVGYAVTAYPNGAGVAYAAPVARQVYYNRPVLGGVYAGAPSNCDPVAPAW